MLEAIAFDADDTLWHTEFYYRETEQRFLDLLAPYGIQPQPALEVLHRVEIANLAYFGYGIRGFTFSMIEAAIQATGEHLRARDVQAIIELGRGMTAHEIRLLPAVAETLSLLAPRYPLLLITKGDALDQQSKVDRSGLGQFFRWVDIIPDKHPAAYRAVLDQRGVRPERFVMVGNSLRSDIAPVLTLGGYAVYVPYELTWAHESSADLPADQSRFFQVESMAQVPGIIERIEGRA